MKAWRFPVYCALIGVGYLMSLPPLFALFRWWCKLWGI